MKKKKILSVLLAASLGVGAFALSSCGDGSGVVETDGYVEMPHYDTLDGLYDTDLMYRNLLKTNQGDPGGLWVDKEDDPVYGGYCYMAVTTINNKISSEKYPDYKSVGLEIHRSKDLSNWESCGALDGSGLGIPKGGWIDTWTWAPELLRDEETGMYFMFFSASSDTKHGSTSSTAYMYDRMYLGIAMSESPMGPYLPVTSEDYYALKAAKNPDGSLVEENGYILDENGERVTKVDPQTGKPTNLNGDVITWNTPPIDFGSASAKKYIEGIPSSNVWPCIDAMMFRDDNGELYMYFVQHLSSFKSSISNPQASNDYVEQYNNNEIWGLKMKDMITPDFSTLQILTTPRYTSVRAQERTDGNGNRIVNVDPRTIERTGMFEEIGPGNNVNEGPFVVKNNGKYYLAYAPCGTGNTRYSICQAVSDSPLGPFVKLQDYNPVIGTNEMNDYLSCTGHNSFVKIGDELWALYHAFWGGTQSYGRCVAADRVAFIRNDALGFDVMYGNGPSLAVQPANELHTGMTNVAKTAKISVSKNGDKNTVKYLTDGIFTVQDFTRDMEFSSKGSVTVTLEWDAPQEIEAVFIYNSADYYKAFAKVDEIKFQLSESPAWSSKVIFSKAIIKNLLCNPDNVNENEMSMRQGGGAVASFRPIKVTKMTFTISSKYTKEYEDGSDGTNRQINVSEIYVMGKGV